MNEPVRAICEPDKSFIGVVYPSGIVVGPGPGFVPAREFSGRGTVFGIKVASTGKLSQFEQGLCKSCEFNPASTSPPLWQH